MPISSIVKHLERSIGELSFQARLHLLYTVGVGCIGIILVAVSLCVPLPLAKGTQTILSVAGVFCSSLSSIPLAQLFARRNRRLALYILLEEFRPLARKRKWTPQDRECLKELEQRFVDKVGLLNCRDIRKAGEFSCAECVGETARIVHELSEGRKQD